LRLDPDPGSRLDPGPGSRFDPDIQTIPTGCVQVKGKGMMETYLMVVPGFNYNSICPPGNVHISAVANKMLEVEVAAWVDSFEPVYIEKRQL
jgi:hypothetical protein